MGDLPIGETIRMPVVVNAPHDVAAVENVYHLIRRWRKEYERDHGVKLADQTMDIESLEDHGIERLANDIGVVYNFKWKIERGKTAW